MFVNDGISSSFSEALVFGLSQPMQVIRHTIERVAGTSLPVLICGENGTGKEVVARLIHSRSPRHLAPFVKVSCPAIPGTLLESELFGYERGAFTGAYSTKPGRVEAADRGTLFLDEIGELDPALQAKLLNLLQDGQFCRIGAQEDMRVEARILCATNRNLDEEVEAGSFRRDLLYRINVVSICMPRLRDRREDIARLVNYFLDLYNEMYNCQVPPLSASSSQLFESYDWPGNIRQLENMVKRYVILGSEEAMVGELMGQNQDSSWGSFRLHTPSRLDGSVSLKQLTRQAVQELERKIILEVLQGNHWNRKRAARTLGISYRALLYKMQDAGLPRKHRRAPGGDHNRKDAARTHGAQR